MNPDHAVAPMIQIAYVSEPYSYQTCIIVLCGSAPTYIMTWQALTRRLEYCCIE